MKQAEVWWSNCAMTNDALRATFEPDSEKESNQSKKRKMSKIALWIMVISQLLISPNYGGDNSVGSMTTLLSFLKTRKLGSNMMLQVSDSNAFETIYQVTEAAVKEEGFWGRPSVAWPTIEIEKAKRLDLTSETTLFDAFEKVADSLGCELKVFEWGLIVFPKNAPEAGVFLTERLKYWEARSPFYRVGVLDFHSVKNVYPPGESFSRFFKNKLRHSANISQKALPTGILWNDPIPQRNIAGTNTVSLIGDWSFDTFVNVVGCYYSRYWTVENGQIVFDVSPTKYEPQNNKPG